MSQYVTKLRQMGQDFQRVVNAESKRFNRIVDSFSSLPIG